MDKGQFKPVIDVRLVGTLDNDVNPTQLNVKLIFEDEELELYHIPAKII